MHKLKTKSLQPAPPKVLVQSLTEKRNNLPGRKNIVYGEYRLRVYSIGWLAYMTQLSRKWIHLRERQGILPKPLFTMKGGRWYTSLELRSFTAEILAFYQGTTSGAKHDWVKLHDALVKRSQEARKKLKGLVANPQDVESLFGPLPNEDKLIRALKQSANSVLMQREVQRRIGTD